ncbi:MAG: biotin--[acetyl-CoA-carboxylase] ligase [Paracoccaceae bacterium]
MSVWPQGYGLVILDEVDSTNEEARRRAGQAEAPLWIMARRQVAGRGRHGRIWEEAGGNLYATLLMRPKGGAAEAGLLSFAASLAVAELFESHGGAAELKWPNDALLNGGKAAGILLEGAGAGGRLDWLAIGCGVNLISHPAPDPAAAHPPTSLLAATGAEVAPEDALPVLASALARWMSALDTEGFAPLREAWLSRAARLGERIEARLPRETLTGVFEDMDAEGALVLRTATGARRIHAADIYFR